MSVPYMPVLKKKSKKKSYHFNLSRVDIIIILLCVKKSYYNFWNISTFLFAIEQLDYELEISMRWYLKGNCSLIFPFYIWKY